MVQYVPRLQAGRFVVEMDGVIVAHFQEVSGLSVEVAFHELVEGGNNEYVHRLPGPLKYSNITLKRGLSDSRQFLEWRPTIANGRIVVEPKKLSIMVLDHDRDPGQPVKQWDIDEAYPVKWTGPELRASSMEVVVESIELAHKGWKEVK